MLLEKTRKRSTARYDCTPNLLPDREFRVFQAASKGGKVSL